MSCGPNAKLCFLQVPKKEELQQKDKIARKNENGDQIPERLLSSNLFHSKSEKLEEVNLIGLNSKG